MAIVDLKVTSIVASTGSVTESPAGTNWVTALQTYDSTFVGITAAAGSGATGPHIAYIVCDYQDISLPAGAVITNVTNYIMAYGTVGSYLLANRHDQAPGGSGGVGPMTAGWAYYSGGTTDVGGVPATTAASINSCQIRLQPQPGNFQGINLAYLRVSYIGSPSVSVQTPTGNIKTSTPNISWIFSKDSQSPTYQSKYQVRVFTAAQYGIGGFDPATSPASYDTGIVAGAGTSAVVPTSARLKPGVYRAYVRAATTNSGQDQWSVWTPTYSGSFTVAPPTINVWDGASFIKGQALVWDGSAYVEATDIKYWNGSGWVNSVYG